MPSSALYSAGDILRVVFAGLVDGTTKARPALFWKYHDDDSSKALVSGIWGTKTGREGEIPVSPGIHNGLTKPSVIRLETTVYIPLCKIIMQLGALNPLELVAIRDLMQRYSKTRQAASPCEFRNGEFDIF